MKGLDKFEPDAYYHLVGHAIGSENLFRTDDNYRYFLQKYAHHVPSVCSTLAYCLMPNHIHFLIRIHEESTLQRHPKFKGDFHKLVMQKISNLLNAYAKAYNKVYDRRGSLWIDQTKRFKIASDRYLMSTIKYIHQNPVKHNFVNDPSDWTFSSYHTFLSEKPTLLDRQQVLKWFGDEDGFVAFHKKQRVDLASEWEF